MSKEITNVSIDVLKIHPRNTEFFDDISGKQYEEFKNSIKEEGIISEIIVAPDMTIISGHQRYKAAKELGIKIVPIRIREDLIDEDKKLKVLLAANFGRSKNDESKQRKVAVEYVKLCGYKNGEMGNGRKKSSKLTLDQIAKQLGMSKSNLKRVLSIERNLPEPIKQLLDSGIISKTIASDLISSLSNDEQEELIKSMDTTQKITQKQVQQYIDRIKQLENDNPKVKELQTQLSELKTEKNILERKVKLNQEEADKYNKLKSKIEFLTKQKNDLGRQIDSATELAGLTVRLQELLETELAPIKFKRCIEELGSSDVCVENLMDVIDKIDNWSDEMKKLLSYNININKKRDEKLKIMEQEQEKTLTKVEKLEKNTNVICSPFHSKRKKNFKKICKARVWNLFNNEADNYEYVLFSSFLFKKIYADIASKFELDSWFDLNMENYEQDNSMYSQAKDFITYWTPDSWYIKYCVNSLIEKRDNGLLSSEKCRALTQYLKATNNGEINPFDIC